MLKRVVTALIGIPVGIFLILYPGGVPFAAASALVAAAGVLEFYGGARRIGARPVEWAGTGASVLLVAIMHAAQPGEREKRVIAVVAGLVIVSLLVELARRKRSPVLNVGATVLGAAYVGLLSGFLVLLRARLGEVSIWGHRMEVGAAAVLFVFLCTWVCDTGAYLVGRCYGRTKLAPKLSPGKTVEGAIAGLVFTVLAGVLFGLPIGIPAGHALALGLLLGVAAQLGDLSESAIKREISIKDFGTLVPGHGGVLDRFDSVLFAGPAAYYYITCVLHNWPG